MFENQRELNFDHAFHFHANGFPGKVVDLMNVCLIAYTYYEMDFRVRRYAEMLANGKNHVDVFALRGKDQEEFGTLNGVNVCRIQERDYNEKGPVNYLLNYIRFMFSGMIRLARLHARRRYDIVHVHNVPDFLVFMAIRPRLSGAKVILDIHDILPEFFCQKFRKTMDSGFARLLRVLEWLSVRFADHVIVANDIWREKLILRDGLSPDRCTTIMNYPPLDFYRKTGGHKADGVFRLIYPGTLSYQHGLDILIRAMVLVVKEVRNIQLHVYGHKDASQFKQVLEDLIREHDLTDVVFFHDAVPPEKLGPIIADFDVGVVPKRGGVFAGEAFSTKVFDFMAAGIPVIASRTKIDTYYFDDSQIKFFTPEDAGDLARGIVELYRNPAQRAVMADNGKKYIEKNHWDVKKTLYSDILEKIVP
jgi:glycosyltransferase involved in cell wall biosynthesis